MTDDSQSEEVAKYKRILSLARSNLEANQATIAVKDNQIAQLISALEEERKTSHKKGLSREDEVSLTPRNILRRVDVDGSIWILIEYDDHDDTWKNLEDEQALNDFIQRVPGVPLRCPSRCLSVEESDQIIEECKGRIERIVEEFRRFKVRTEIARKQKDAETRHSIAGSVSNSGGGNSISGGITKSGNVGNTNIYASVNGLVGEMSNSSSGSNNSGTTNNNSDEIQRMRELLKEQEVKWKQSYDKIARENEILRSKGGESVLATQWRGRYETCLKEKEDMIERLKSYSNWSQQLSASGKPVDLAYVELQEEFKIFRKKVLQLDEQQQQKINNNRSNNSISSLVTNPTISGAANNNTVLLTTATITTNQMSSDLSSSSSELAILVKEYEKRTELIGSSSNNNSNGKTRNAALDAFYGSSSSANNSGSSSSGSHRSSSSRASSTSRLHSRLGYRTTPTAAATTSTDNGDYGIGGGSGNGGMMTASKIKYVRHMVYQYLSCKEPEVKLHIETALMAIFRMTEQERECIESKRREETQDTLSSITNYLGSLTSSST